MGDDILTDREYEVAALANDGLSNKEIARLLFLTEGTVKQYLHSAFAKLGIQRRIFLRDHLPLRVIAPTPGAVSSGEAA